MATKKATHTVNGFEGLEIVEYTGSETVGVSDEQVDEARRVSALEAAAIAET